jgi:hypothetical protein
MKQNKTILQSGITTKRSINIVHKNIILISQFAISKIINSENANEIRYFEMGSGLPLVKKKPLLCLPNGFL